MNIAKKQRSLALTLVPLLVSCQSPGPLAPTPPRPVTVQIVGPSRAYFAQRGDLRVGAFDVWVREPNGSPAAAVPVRLFVSRGPGQIIPPESLTDAGGRIRALFCAFSPPLDIIVQVAAVVFDDTTSCSILLPAGEVADLEDRLPGASAWLKILKRLPGRGAAHSHSGL